MPRHPREARRRRSPTSHAQVAGPRAARRAHPRLRVRVQARAALGRLLPAPSPRARDARGLGARGRRGRDARRGRAAHGIEADALVLATGFASTRQPYAELVRGESGTRSPTHWSEGMTSFGSTVVSGFPNLFVLNGPNASLGHNSSGAHDRGAGRLRRARLERRDPGRRRAARRTPRPSGRTPTRSPRPRHPPPGSTGGCRNWYVDERSGRLTLLWPGTVDAFRARLARADGSEFRLTRRVARAPGTIRRQVATIDDEGDHDVPLRFGYKASAEQFGPTELLDFADPRRGGGVRLGLHLRPPAAVAARGRPRAGIGPVARRARRAHVAGADRHVGAHADLPLQPDGRSRRTSRRSA